MTKPTLVDLIRAAEAAGEAAREAERRAERAYKVASDMACAVAGVKWDRRRSQYMPSEAQRVWAIAYNELHSLTKGE